MEMIRNLSLAIRTLRKSPGLSLTVVLLLAFGIGANSAMYSVLHAVLLRPIPGVERPEELVRVRRTQNGRVQSNQSYPDYLDFRDRTTTLAGLAAERTGQMLLAGPSAQMVPASIVSGNYFQVLGVRAAAGRLLNPEDDRVPGGHSVAVLSEVYWRRQYAGDPQAIGKTIVLNRHPFTIVGIAAAPFEGVLYGEASAVWIPMTMVRQFVTRVLDDRLLTMRSAGWLTFYARVRGGNVGAAQAEMNTIAAQLEARYPESNQGRRFELNPNPGMTVDSRANLRNLLGLLQAAVCLVLLIACGNVATLMLARAAARSREMAIRLAVGAGRGALVSQVMTENALLGAAGAGLGLMLAPWMRSLLRAVWGGPEIELAYTSGVDPRVLGFTLGVSMLSVMLFGLAPALSAARTDPGSVLKTAGPRAGGGRLQRIWVIAQVTISVALVAGGALVLRSMQRIVAVDPGYQPDRVWISSMDLSILGYSAERGTEFFAGLLARAEALPGVRAASLAKSSPAVDWSDRLPLARPGEGASVTADRNVIGPGYFRTLGITLLAGREFGASDSRGSAPVAIVSRSLAARLWPGQDPIGKQVVQAPEHSERPAPLQVVGVAADSHYRSVLEDAPPILYIALYQNYDSISRLMVSTAGPASLRTVLPGLIQQMDPELPVRPAVTMREQLAQSVWRQRAAAGLLGFFGLMALALACAGIHGVVAYSTARRTREIGIRMALGAGRTKVLRQVMGEGLSYALAGVVLGLPLAFLARPALRAFLFQAQAVEPVAVVGVPMVFVVVAMAATVLPARRAAAVDPAVALREE